MAKINIKFMMSYKLLQRQDLSLGAKVLYAIIHNRYQCSLRSRYKDRFIDPLGDTYCILTITEVRKLLHCSQPTATKYYRELVDAKLIERVKRYHNRADLIKLCLGNDELD